MGSLKALGLDGYQPLFFKSIWDLTGQALHQFTQEVLRGEEIPLEAAEALLVQIPKEKRPSTIRGFKPISLCNVNMKVVSKMIVNRLKEVLCGIISPNQALFMPGRQTINNIVNCQKIVHSIRYSKAKRGGMVVKLNLEKAYDRLEWNFIENTLRDALIPNKLIDVIMSLL